MGSDPPKASDLPEPGDNNKSAGVSAQALLMENYTTPSLPVSGGSSMCASYAPVDGAAPQVHTFIIGTDDKQTVHHYQQNPASFTGWTAEDIGLTGSSTEQLVAGYDDKGLVLFRLSTSLEVSYMRAIPIGKKGRVTFLPKTWTTIGAFPSGHKNKNRVLSLGQDMRLYAGWERTSDPNKKLVWEIDWSKTSDNWTQLEMGNKHKHFYTLKGGDDTVFTSLSDDKGNKRFINYWNGQDKWTTIWSNSKNKSEQLEVTTLPQQKNRIGVYSRESTKRLYWQSYDTSTKKTTSTELMDGKDIIDFTVVQGETSEFEKIFAVTEDNLLYSVSYNGTDFSDPIQVGGAATAIIGASFPGDTNRTVMFYTHTSGNLVEITQSSDEAFQRTHVTIEPEVPTKDARSSRGVTAGYHLGSPVVFSMKDSTSTPHIHRFTANSEADILKHLWTQDEADFPKGNIPSSIWTTTDEAGRIVLFCEDDKGGVWVRTFGVPQGWQSLGNGPSGGISKVFSAGLVNDVVTLMSVVTFTSETKVYNVIVTAGDDFGKWKQATSNDHGSATSVSVGRTSFADGFFTNSKNGGIYFYELGTQTSKQTYSKGTRYGTVYATPTSTDEVIAESSNTLHYVTPVEDVRISSTSFAPGKLSMYYNKSNQLQLLDSYFQLPTMTFRMTMTSPGVFSTAMLVASGSYDPVGLSDELIFGRDTKKIPAQFQRKRHGPNPTYTVPRLQQKTGDNDERPLSRFASWNINFMVTDKNGAGVANTKVSYKPVADDVVLRVNGKLVSVGQSDPEMVAFTNARGVVNVMSVADSLNAPVFEVWTDLHTDLDNEATSVMEPNNEEQLFLGKVTLEQLQDATVHDLESDGESDGESNDEREPLFPSDQEGLDQQFVLGLHATVNAGKQSTDITNAFDLSSITSRNNRGTILHSTTHARAHEIRRLDPKTNAKTSFHIEYTTSSEGVKGVKYQALPQSAVSKIIDNMPGEDFIGTYGELMASANGGFVEVTQTAFTDEDESKKKGSFKKGLKAGVMFVQNGVKKVWKGVIEFVEDVMSAAQSLFAHLGVLFKKLFGWLAAFFKWKDILNTSKLIQTHISTYGDNAEKAFAAMGKGIDDSIDILKKNFGGGLPEFPDAMVDALDKTADDSLAQSDEVNQEFGDPGRSGEDEDDKSKTKKKKTVYGTDPQATWLTDVFTGVAPTMEVGDLFDADQETTDLLGQLMTEVTPAMDAASKDQGANQADMDAKISEKGTSFSFKDFMPNLKDFILNAALDGTKDAVDSFFKLGGKLLHNFIKMLNKKIKIPIISTLWKTVITRGEDLTILSLISLLGAVPATLAYKLMILVKTGKIYAPVVAKAKDIKNRKYQVALDEVTANLNGIVWDKPNTKPKAFPDENLSAPPTDRDPIVGIILGFAYSGSYAAMGIADSIDIVWPGLEPTFLKWYGWSVSIVAQIISHPRWVAPVGVIDYEAFGTLLDAAENIAWVSALPLLIATVPMFDISDIKMSKTMFTLGALHTAGYVFLTVVDGIETDFSDSKQYPISTFGMKVGQNFLTSFGEMSWGLRAGAVKVLRAPEPEPGSKAGAIATIVVWEIVAFIAPAGLSFVRTGQDLYLWRKHRVGV